MSELGEDLVVDRGELVADLLELFGGEMSRRVFDRVHHSAISTAPSGALTQVRTISPSEPCTRPLRMSRTRPEHSSPTQVWQIPMRHPKGSDAPACSPATRIGVSPFEWTSTLLRSK